MLEIGLKQWEKLFIYELIALRDEQTKKTFKVILMKKILKIELYESFDEFGISMRIANYLMESLIHLFQKKKYTKQVIIIGNDCD